MAKTRYAVELKSGVGVASFMAGGKAVELSEENPRYETDDENEYRGLLDLPFLKDAGETKSGKREAAE